MPIQRKCDRCDTILPSSDSSPLCSECIAAEAAALRLKTGQALPPSHASVASKPHAPPSKLEPTGSRVNPAKAPYEPLPVPSLTKISVLKKFVRDHRSLVGAAVGILLVLTMAIVVTSVMTIRGREKSRIIAPQTSNNQIPQKVRAKPEDNLQVSDASRQQLLRLQALNGRN